MSDLSKTEVFKVLAAAEFAAAFALYLDVLVTIDFGRMGVLDADGARSELQRFLKAADAWLRQRVLPVLWVASIERDRNGGYHAHIAIHVPPVRKANGNIHGPRHRTHFRKWAREAIARRAGKPVPKAVNIRCTLTQSIIGHWICVTYLLKGYDRASVLATARVAPSGVELTLGDILPFPYSSAGEVGLARRLFVCGGLGPGQRAIGVPRCGLGFLPPVPNLMSLSVSGGPPPPPRYDDENVARVPRPFRSWVEDGVFDVRRIFGDEFASFVTGIARPRAAVSLGASDPYAGLTVESHLQHLGV